jgi:hypothetical protein
MPSTSFLTPLDYLDLSPASTPSTLTTRNKIDGKEKQRLSRQARKLSQILGELPQETAALAHPVKGSTPESSVPPMGLSQLHASCSRPSFSEPSTRSPRLSHIFHTVTASTMPPSLLPSVHDGSSRTGHRRRSSIISAHINQLDLTRFGLGRRDSGSTSSAHSDENAQHTDRRSLVEEALSDSSNLHSLDVTRPRNKPRWRSVYNPRPMEFEAHPRRSENSSMPAYSSKRSVSLWAKRRPSNEDQRSLANQGQKNITSGAHPPLTESERILYLRRGRKLTQVGLARHLGVPGHQCSLHRSLEQYLLSPCTVPRRRLRTYQQHQTPFRVRGQRHISRSPRAICVPRILDVHQGTDLIPVYLRLLMSPFRPHLHLTTMSKHLEKSRLLPIPCPIPTKIPIRPRKARTIGQRTAPLSVGAD